MQLQKHLQSLIKIETGVGLDGYGQAGTHGPIVHAHLEKEILPLQKGRIPWRSSCTTSEYYPFLANDTLGVIHPDDRFCWWFYWLQAYHSTGGAFLHTCSYHNIGSLIHTMAIANTARDFVATDRRIGQGAFIEVVGQHDLNATAIFRCRIVPVGYRTGRGGYRPI